MKQKIIEGLPIAGIIAFSGCSVNALAHLFLGAAENDTWWYWVAAILVELCTAWLVWSIVDTMGKLTKSRITKQDRRFYRAILVAFIVLTAPSLTASVVANYIEFKYYRLLLAVLFPVLSVACAVGAALPEVVKRYEKKKEADKEDKEADKLAREAAKALAEAEAVRQLTEAAGQPETQLPIIPILSSKKDRVAWLGDNWPISDVYPADLADTWQVTLRTVSRYLSEIKDEEEVK